MGTELQRGRTRRLIEIDVLGEVQIRIGGTPVTLSKARRDLLALLAAATEPVDLNDAARAALISPRSVRSTLTRTSRLLGLDEPLHRLEHARSSRIVLDDAAFVVDARLLRQRLAHAELLLEQQHDERAADVARQALELWRGDPLSNTATATSAMGGEIVDALRAARARLEAIAQRAASSRRPAEDERSAPDPGRVDPLPAAVAVAAVGCSIQHTMDPAIISQIAGVGDADAQHDLTAFGFAVEPGGCRASAPVVRAVLDRMDPTQIRTIHRRVAALLAPGAIDGPRRTPWRQHVLAGGDQLDRLEALAIHLRAAGEAQRQGDVRAARTLLHEALELVVDAREEADILARCAALAQQLGDWNDAIRELRRAAGIAEDAGDLERAAQVTLTLANLTWDPEIGAEVDARLVRLRPGLAGRQQLTDRIDLCLAGGTFQDGRSGDDRIDPGRLRGAIARIGTIVDREERAQAFIHARKATLDHVTPAQSLTFAEQIGLVAHESVDYRAHGLLACFVDQLRLDRRGAALTTLRAWSNAWPMGRAAAMDFSVHAAHTCWALMIGRYDVAARHLAEQAVLAQVIGGTTVQQVLVGQRYWLARQHDDRATLEQIGRIAGAAFHQSGSTLWAAVAGSCAQQLDPAGERRDELTHWVEVVASSCPSLAELPRGPHRLPTLTLLAEQLFALTVDGPERATRPRGRALRDLAAEVRQVLLDEPQPGVLAGWPTVFLGPTAYPLGLAAAAAGDRQHARDALVEALHRNRHTPPLTALTRRQLASL